MRASVVPLVALLALGALAAEKTRITGVSVGTEGGRSVVRVTTSRPPNFTTFPLSEPPRAVIEFSEAAFEGVPEEQTVEDGAISKIKALTYAQGVARLMVVLAQKTEFDVAAEGNALVVKVIRPLSAPVVAAHAPAPAEEEAAPVASPLLAREEAAPPPPAEEESAPVGALPPAEKEATASAPLAERRSEPAFDRPAAGAPPPAALSRPARPVRLAQAEPTREPSGRAPAAEEVEEETSEIDRPTVMRGPSAMTEIGFRQGEGTQQVFVKTSERVTYRIQETGPTKVVLELANTRIPLRNNKNHLDTRYFPGQVEMIQPTESKKSVRIEITLKNKVAYEARQEAGMLFLDFKTEQ